ncbi:hypothetical protein CANARDRAFT_194517 [[Candida] arabinofermentans NRRL YB-2248]|uniref:MHD domain-containing protein n=1 Tax=[Candida] arabinofermentans NRRL YB-2248 TaxID=983967 RepID=A0A1E4T7F5_9ASCO|nr:hypothetical protein CANARDRAFT_194517 [[Candida] arabinofermentans NRRL YB-2248]
MSEEQRIIYSSNLLFGKSPLEAMEVLKIRQTQLKAINYELAEWFTAYGRLRLHYSDEVNKLFKRGETLFSNLDDPKLQNEKIDSLGLCTPLWSSVMNVIKDEADLFDSSTRKMGRDMIAPLKVFSRQNDSNLIEMDELTNLASELSTANANGEDSSQLTDEWSQRAPYFFEIFENYDYNRLVLLKDVFLKYQTDLNDTINTFKKENETGLEHVLSFNPEDEIKRFSDAAIAKTIPVEVKKPKDAVKARSSTHQSLTAKPAKSHRRSKMLSFGGSSSHGDSNSTKSRQSSIASTATGGFTSSENPTDKKHKERSGLRSKFGTMLKGKKKKEKSGISSHAIPESETSSIMSAPLTNNSHDRIAETAPSTAVHVPIAAAVAVPTQQESYPTMQPTKRSNSATSESQLVPPSTRSLNTGTYSPVPAVPQTVIAEEKEESTSAVPAPVAVAAPSSSSSVVPPPPPSSRKHVLSELTTSNANARHYHGSAPAPPQQRKPTSLDGSNGGVASVPSISDTASSSPSLVPQETGSSTMTRNLTGGATNGGLSSGKIVHPSLTQPGLNASIVELYNASFKEGELVRSNVIGEIAFSNVIDETNYQSSQPAQIDLNISSRSGSELPNFLCNTMFLNQRDPSGTPNSFTITDVSQINEKTLGGLKYMLNSSTPPITITPIWKHEETQSTVIISVKPSQAIINLLQSSDSAKELVLSGTSVSVSIAGAQATSAATKPSGSFNKDKNRVTWSLTSNDLVFSTSTTLEHRFIARFMTTGLAHEGDAGVQVRFTIAGDSAGLVSASEGNLDLVLLKYGVKTSQQTDPFGSVESVNDDASEAESEWTEVPTLITVVAGGYSGHA